MSNFVFDTLSLADLRAFHLSLSLYLEYREKSEAQEAQIDAWQSEKEQVEAELAAIQPLLSRNGTH